MASIWTAISFIQYASLYQSQGIHDSLCSCPANRHLYMYESNTYLLPLNPWLLVVADVVAAFLAAVIVEIVTGGKIEQIAE